MKCSRVLKMIDETQTWKNLENELELTVIGNTPLRYDGTSKLNEDLSFTALFWRNAFKHRRKESLATKYMIPLGFDIYTKMVPEYYVVLLTQSRNS